MSPEAFDAPLKSAGNVGYHPKLQSSGCESANPFGEEPLCIFVGLIEDDMLSKPLLIKQY
jgi:hypothetical protein